MIERILKSNKNLDLDGYCDNIPDFISISRPLFDFDSDMRKKINDAAKSMTKSPEVKFTERMQK